MVSVFECSLRINLLGMVVCGEGGMVGMVKMVTCVLSEKKWDGQDVFFST